MTTVPPLAPTREPEIRRDRATRVAAGLLVVATVVAWVFTVRQTEEGMTMDMDAGVVAGLPAYLAMWSTMMTAMMLPSAIPMISLYAGSRRNAVKRGNPGPHVAIFTGVYVLLWAGVGIPVYFASRAVEAWAMGSQTVSDVLPYGLALLLVTAGIYQLSPLKQICLRACQHPFTFLMSRWRSGYLGTLRIAWLHSAYCLGCCWALMAVLVAAGAMSLPWMLLIAAVVAAEKLLPGGEKVARIAGIALIVAGIVVALRPDLVPVPGPHMPNMPNMPDMPNMSHGT